MWRVLLADDHQVVRDGFRAILERGGFAVVAEAADGEEAARLARTHRPEVAVLDLAMPRCNGIDCARQILIDNPATAVVMVTVHAEEHQVVAALRAGVRGYVVKTQTAVELISAIREVMGGRTYLSPRVSGLLANTYLHGGVSARGLTARQRDVLKLIAEGKRAKDIAEVLGVTSKSAESQRARLMTKLDIHDTPGLVRYAIRSGLAKL